MTSRPPIGAMMSAAPGAITLKSCVPTELGASGAPKIGPRMNPTPPTIAQATMLTEV